MLTLSFDPPTRHNCLRDRCSQFSDDSIHKNAIGSVDRFAGFLPESVGADADREQAQDGAFRNRAVLDTESVRPSATLG